MTSQSQTERTPYLPELEPKSWLITGGAGFLGGNLIEHLLARGQKVTSIDFAPFEYDHLRDQITVVDGDIRDKPLVDKITQGMDYVVHCAAALPLYTPEEIYTTDIDGTRNVFEAALNAGVKRAIHISTTAVYGIPDHHPLYETDEMKGVGPYGEAKVAAEGVVMEFREKGLITPIVRPKSFIGKYRLGIFAMLCEWALEGHNWPNLGKGDNPYQYLDVEDLCDAIWLCATLPEENVNTVFNIGAKEYGTPRTDFQAVLDAAGHGKKVIPIPAAPAIWTLRALEAVGLSPLYKWIYETIVEESFVSIERAEEMLGFKPKYSNVDALLHTLEWYKANKEEIESREGGVSHRVAWKQGALSLAKLFF